MKFHFLLLFIIASLFSCKPGNKSAYQTDLDFMKKHHEMVELSAPDNENAKIMIAAAYQARVMSSSSTGFSNGWLNYDLIESEEIMPHMTAVGGEERIWLAPEGGQFSIFYKKGDPFDFEHWQTPASIDSEPFELINQSSSEAIFQKEIKLTNYSGTEFEIDISRKITVLNKTQAASNLGISLSTVIDMVAYQSENTLTNSGPDWDKETGTLGIWIIGMFTPSDNTTLIAPFHNSEKLRLTDDYFGKVPADRLKIIDSSLLFTGDGHYRSKIGLAIPSAKSVAGAWDSDNAVLTIVQFDLDPNGDYLKSTMEIHENPYDGDVFNSYNDGPQEDGSQLGPFIELESNSVTRALKNGESLVHHHKTYHFEGEKSHLDRISRQVLGISLDKIEQSVTSKK